MQERYLGDVHDFYKFMFIKSLSVSFHLKVALNWYLVNPKELGKKELKLNDGEKRNYLKEEILKELDNNLFCEMKNLEKKKNRIIGDFTKNSHLHRYIAFFNTLLNFKNRENWMEESIRFYKNYEFLFLDPDNGLEPEKTKVSKKKKIKYILNEELRRIFLLKKTVFFCQFQPFNMDHKSFLINKKKQIITQCKIPVEVPILRNRVSPNTFFITITPRENYDKVTKFLLKYVSMTPKTELIDI